MGTRDSKSPPQPSQRVRNNRRAAWTIAGTALLLLLLAFAAAEFAGWPFLRKPLQEAATRAAGVEVTVADGFRLHLIGRPRITAGSLQIAAADGIQAPHLIAAEQIELVWRWSDLWRWSQGKTLRIEALRAHRLDAHLVRSKDGRASWRLGAADKPKVGPTSDSDLPRFGLLQIDSGQVHVNDDLTDTMLQVTVRGSENAGFDASVAGRWRALPLKVQVHAGGALALVRERGGDAPMVEARVSGDIGAARLTFDGRAAALLGQRRIDGKLTLSGPSLAQAAEPLGVTLPSSPPFKLDGALSSDGRHWHLIANRFVVGSSVLAAYVDYDTEAEPPLLSGRLSGTRLALADLGPAIGATPARSDSGRVLPDRRFDLPSLRAMDADLSVAIETLDFGSTALRPLQDLRTHLLLRGGVLKLEELQATVAGGRFNGRTQYDGNHDPARLDVALDLSGVDIARWIPALQSGGKGDTAWLTGALAGNFKLGGNGASTARIFATLDGSAELALHDGTLSHLATEGAGLDIAQALGVVLGGDAALPLRCARIALAVEQGVAQIRRAVLDNPDSTLRAAGHVDLRNETLAVKVQASPKDFSPLSLRSPVTVSGTLASPSVGIDGKRLAGKALGAAALAAVVGPLAALIPFVDTGEGAAGDPCAQGSARARAAEVKVPTAASSPR